MLKILKKLFGVGKYKGHPEGVLITCYYNPKNSPARLAAFNKFYQTIKHLNHRIIEAIVPGVESQLPNSPFIRKINTNSTLWHKEQLLNMLVKDLPPEFKYVFWVDADVIFTNKNWMVDAVNLMTKLCPLHLVQLFEYCVHMQKGETEPSVDLVRAKALIREQLTTQSWADRSVWRSYAANYVTDRDAHEHQNYDIRGHVGFAWGCRRVILEACPLYDRALIGGADGIIAYAATGQLEKLDNIREMFADNLDEVYEWGRKFHRWVVGRVGYVPGDLYHIWHGDIKDRQYYKRIKEFAPHLTNITERDAAGLYTTDDQKAKQYVSGYFDKRDPTAASEAERRRRDRLAYERREADEARRRRDERRDDEDRRRRDDDSFWQSVAYGYITNDGLLGGMMGGNLAGGMVGDALNTSDEPRIPVERDEEAATHVPHHAPTTQPSAPSTNDDAQSECENYS